MYGQQGLSDIFFLMLYGSVGMLALVGCFYLLFRRGNCFAREVTPPVSLRRWVATFLAAMWMSHMWWFLLRKVWLEDDALVRNIVSIALDNMILVPLVMVMLLRLLQDRHRPLWPVFLLALPVPVMAAVGISQRDPQTEIAISVYTFVILVAFVIYLILAVRKYGYWLADNYADLENKEVWQSLLAPVCFVPFYVAYTFHEGQLHHEYISQYLSILLVFYLVWRVETLQQLDSTESVSETLARPPLAHTASPTLPSNIGDLLQRHCEDSMLYLQHDLTLAQLAEAIGTNRTYLSQYFAHQGITYNNYIKRLRIGHFVRLYNETSANGQQPVKVRRLAEQSGFSSYYTFSTAFKQFVGQTVTAWMKRKEQM